MISIKTPGSEEMYSVGDMIVHSGAGVCRVAEITTLNLSGVCKDKLYYILSPLYQDGTVSVPVESKKVMMRPVISSRDGWTDVERTATG